MFNPSPAKVADVTVPILVTVPNATSQCAAKPARRLASGHLPARRHERSDVCAAGCRCVRRRVLHRRVDGPAAAWHHRHDEPVLLHSGVTPSASVRRSARSTSTSRTTPLASPAKTASSMPAGGKDGLYYFNFPYPLTWRDNLRQSEVDVAAPDEVDPRSRHREPRWADPGWRGRDADPFPRPLDRCHDRRLARPLPERHANHRAGEPGRTDLR